MKRLPPWALLGLCFCSGASALIFENLWQRIMTLELGASAPATTAILTSFFLGIGLGSCWGGRLVSRCRRSLTVYGALELGIGLFGLAVPVLLALVRVPYLALLGSAVPGTLAGFSTRFLTAILVTLPATLCMGANVPAMN